MIHEYSLLAVLYYFMSCEDYLRSMHRLVNIVSYPYFSSQLKSIRDQAVEFHIPHTCILDL